MDTEHSGSDVNIRGGIPPLHSLRPALQIERRVLCLIRDDELVPHPRERMPRDPTHERIRAHS